MNNFLVVLDYGFWLLSKKLRTEVFVMMNLHTSIFLS